MIGSKMHSLWMLYEVVARNSHTKEGQGQIRAANHLHPPLYQVGWLLRQYKKRSSLFKTELTVSTAKRDWQFQRLFWQLHQQFISTWTLSTCRGVFIEVLLFRLSLKRSIWSRLVDLNGTLWRQRANCMLAWFSAACGIGIVCACGRRKEVEEKDLHVPNCSFSKWVSWSKGK